MGAGPIAHRELEIANYKMGGENTSGVGSILGACEAPASKRTAITWPGFQPFVGELQPYAVRKEVVRISGELT